MTRQRTRTKKNKPLLPPVRITRQEGVFIAVLILLTVLSVTLFSNTLSSPEFYSETIRVLDDQKTEALTLSVAVAAASTALSTLPDDMASPIADELADLSLPLFLIVAIIYLEIFMLTTFGWITSTFLLPAAFLLLIGFILWRKEFLLVWIKKILVLSVALTMLIPASATITSHIEDTFSEVIDQRLHAASHIVNAAESDGEEDTNAILSFFSGIADNVTSLVNAARNMLSTLVDAVATLLITSCVIPVLTVLLFLQAIKTALNVNIPTEHFVRMLPSARKHRKMPEEAEPVNKIETVEE